MDALSQLLLLGRSHVELDVRCLLDGPFAMAHDVLPAGEAAFHLLLAGQCRLRTADGRALRLVEGDFVLLPAGGAHEIHDATAGPAAAMPMRELAAAGGAVLPVKCNTDTPDRASVDLLCGRFVYERGAGELLMRALPDPLHVGLGEPSGFASLQMLTGVLRAEASNLQPGARAIVNALGQALLAYALRAYGRDTQVGAVRLARARCRRAARAVDPGGDAGACAAVDGRVARRRVGDVARDLRAAFSREGGDERRRVRHADPDDARVRVAA